VEKVANNSDSSLDHIQTSKGCGACVLLRHRVAGSDAGARNLYRVNAIAPSFCDCLRDIFA
jgi:hypothetical protein